MVRTIIVRSAHISAASFELALKQELKSDDIRPRLERTRSLEAAILVAEPLWVPLLQAS
jgi:hypothetical protein